MGGGVVGGGIALDAATRGLSVGLVEARDFASGTSSRSSKLIHGGLRYLEMLDFRLVAEALGERSLLLEKLAPHLVRPVPFVYPLTHYGWERFYAGSGVLLYDSMGVPVRARSRGVPHHRHLTRRGARRIIPSLRKRRPHRRHPLLRRPSRRRPPHDVPVPHGGRLWRPRRQPHPRHGAASAKATGSPAPASRTWRPATSSTSPPSRSSTPPGCGPTRRRRWPASAASSTCAPPRACTSSSRATASAARPD